MVDVSETRQIDVGVILEGDKKKHNKIKTSKYTLLMFIPKNLSEQFRRVVNFYFLIVTVIAIVIGKLFSYVYYKDTIYSQRIIRIKYIIYYVGISFNFSKVLE